MSRGVRRSIDGDKAFSKKDKLLNETKYSRVNSPVFVIGIIM